MINSSEDVRAGFSPTRNPNASRVGSFPKNGRLTRGNLRHFFKSTGTREAKVLCYRGTDPDDKMPISIRHSLNSAIAETFQMTLTVAHISPIMSVVAGVLILIMPRLLNLVVALFLILNGLIGLGLFKWLHM
jgi:hypothetical protein